MAINISTRNLDANLDTIMLKSMYTVIDHLLEPNRAARWVTMLRSGKRIHKLNPFEFFEMKRRSQTVNWYQTENWLNFESFLKVVSSCPLVGLQWRGHNGVFAFDGTCRDLLDLTSKLRVDSWSIVLDKNMSVVTTHEGNYGIMSW